MTPYLSYAADICSGETAHNNSRVATELSVLVDRWQRDRLSVYGPKTTIEWMSRQPECDKVGRYAYHCALNPNALAHCPVLRYALLTIGGVSGN